MKGKFVLSYDKMPSNIGKFPSNIPAIEETGY